MVHRHVGNDDNYLKAKGYIVVKATGWDYEPVMRKINELGAQGWEMVSHHSNSFFTFKRKIQG